MRLDPLHLFSQASGMASIAQCINAEQKVRDMLNEEGVPQPDVVEYGATCIRLFWSRSKSVLVVDIDPPPDEDDSS